MSFPSWLCWCVVEGEDRGLQATDAVWAAANFGLGERGFTGARRIRRHRDPHVAPVEPLAGAAEARAAAGNKRLLILILVVIAPAGSLTLC